VKEVISFVKESGGIQYANEVMNRYHQEALDLIRNLPESDYKKSLIQLVQFTIERNN
jgi:octaprenyl-diphosphate synthase